MSRTDKTPQNPITNARFDEDAIELIATTLGTTVELAPFHLPDGTVYKLRMPGENGKPSTTVTLWPSIGRVDAISEGAVAVFTEVIDIDMVGTVEVQFRRASREMLIVARGGKIIVRA